MRPVMEISKRFEGERLNQAVVTIYHHNQENRKKASEYLGFPVTRKQFPEGRQMRVTFWEDGSVHKTRCWPPFRHRDKAPSGRGDAPVSSRPSNLDICGHPQLP